MRTYDKQDSMNYSPTYEDGTGNVWDEDGLLVAAPALLADGLPPYDPTDPDPVAEEMDQHFMERMKILKTEKGLSGEDAYTQTLTNMGIAVDTPPDRLPWRMSAVMSAARRLCPCDCHRDESYSVEHHHPKALPCCRS